uniref:IQ motif containing F1 n=1 Tax=Jaculus jaculus TaxID=51337 RepID=A0A8C5KLZ4_JACJA
PKGEMLVDEAYQTNEPEKKKKKQPKPSPKPKVEEKKPSLPPSDKVLAATTIQKWWRGRLVQRTLFHAALRALIIQNWWRKTMARTLEKKRREALRSMVLQTRASATLQSWVRMLLVRQHYSRLLNAVRTIQVSWRSHSCHSQGFFQGSYELMGNQLRLSLDIFLGSHICRISDCIHFPIKN